MAEGKFEKEWRDAFEGAELRPSPKVWTGVEASIANDEAAKYKRGLIYYKWLAAAVLLMFMGLLGYLGYQSKYTEPSMGEKERLSEQRSTEIKPEETENAPQVTRPENNQLADGVSQPSKTGGNQSVQENKVEENKLSENSIKRDLAKGESSSPGTNQQQRSELASSIPDDNKEIMQTKFDQQIARNEVAGDQLVPTDENLTGGEGLPGSTREETTTLDPFTTRARLLFADVNPLYIDKLTLDSMNLALMVPPDHLYAVPIVPWDRGPGEMSLLWAGINMSPGYFDPNYQQGPQPQGVNSPSDFAGFQTTEENNTGLSIAFGVGMGMQLSPRWELSGGLQYFSNNVQSSTNAVFNDKTPVLSPVLESLDFGNSQSRIAFAPTDLDNSFQFLSIPVQAGYLLLDQKIKVKLNAGIATDLFLKNKISAVNRPLESITIRPGSEAPYRSVYFNGLIGVEASYEFLPRYSIALQPRYKVAINELTKPSTNYSSIPSSFGFGVGVKYHFK